MDAHTTPYLTRSGLVRRSYHGRSSEDELLIVFYQLLLVLACCLLGSTGLFFNNDIGELTPIDPYVMDGGDLIMNCTLGNNYKGPLNSSHIFFKVANERVPDDKMRTIGEKTMQLTLKKVTHAAYPMTGVGVYCYLRGAEGPVQIVSHQFVTIARPLVKPAINDCEVFNWEYLNCSWTPASQNTGLQGNKVELFWTFGPIFKKTAEACPKRSGNTCYWMIDEKNLTLYHEGMSMKVIVMSWSAPSNKNLDPMLKLEEISDEYFVNATISVKPRAVRDLSVLNQKTENILVAWQPPVNNRDLQYSIKYRSQWQPENQWQEDIVVNENEWHLISATAFTEYTVIVRAKPLLAGKWSEPSQINFTTPPDVPGANPEVAVGGYYSKTMTGGPSRTVIVYWQQLPQQLHNSYHINWYVSLMSNGQCLIEPSDLTSPVIKEVPHSHNQTYLSVIARQECSFNFSVRAENNQGFSLNLPKIITVTSVNSDVSLVSGVVADAYNETSVNVRWDPPPQYSVSSHYHYTSHTVYWCKGTHKYYRCQGQLFWEEFKIPKTNYTVHLAPGEVYSNYIFAVSCNTAKISRGMVWSRCTYDVKKLSQAPEVVNTSTQAGPGTIKVSWSANDCHNNRGYILYYLIYYCPTYNDNLNCSGSVSQVEVIGDSMSYTIENLNANVVYIVWMESITAAGASRASSKPTHITVKGPWATAGAIVGITIAVILILAGIIGGIIALICNCRQCHHWFTGLRIEIPDKMVNGGNSLRGTSTSSTQPLRLHSFGDLNKSQHSRGLFYNQQFSIESGSADSGNGSLSLDHNNSLPRRNSLSISEGSDADDVFNSTLNNDIEILDPEHQVTVYHIDKNHHPTKPEHANKNGYVKMGDNGVAVFLKTSVRSLPKVMEEEESMTQAFST